MSGAKKVLDKVRWHREFDLAAAEISYIDRKAPHGYKLIRGDQITEFQHSFFKLGETIIPYHLISKIVYNDRTLYEKRPKPSKPRRDEQIQ